MWRWQDGYYVVELYVPRLCTMTVANHLCPLFPLMKPRTLVTNKDIGTFDD